jgi:hypothetical protein
MDDAAVLIQRAATTMAPAPSWPAPIPVPSRAAVEGIERPAAEAVPAQELEIDAALLPEIAVLWVRSGQEGECLALAAGGQAPPASATLSPKHQIAGQPLDLNEVWQLMGLLSAGQPALVRWFRTFIAWARQAGSEPVLVIVDLSETTIPWEMLRLHKTERRALGSDMIAVRWQLFTDDDYSPVLLRQEGDACAGKVLAHLDPDERAVQGVEPFLAPLLRLGPTEYADIRDLGRELRKDSTGFGLVYLLCHGFLGQSPLDIALGSDRKTEARLCYADLLDQHLGLLGSSPAIVFLNACQTGALVSEREYLVDKRRVGLAELFIGKGARGVIGTLERVELTEAVRVAHDFFKTLQARPNCSVAAALRELRADALGQVGQDPTEAQLTRWYYSFLYVFYGHPRTTLRV